MKITNLQMARLYVIVCRTMNSLKYHVKRYKEIAPRVVKSARAGHQASIARSQKKIAELDALVSTIEGALIQPGLALDAADLLEVWPAWLDAKGRRLQDWRLHQGVPAQKDPAKALEVATRTRP